MPNLWRECLGWTVRRLFIYEVSLPADEVRIFERRMFLMDSKSVRDFEMKFRAVLVVRAESFKSMFVAYLPMVGTRFGFVSVTKVV